MKLRLQTGALLAWVLVAILCLALAMIIRTAGTSRHPAPPIPPGQTYAGQKTVVAFSEETMAGDLVIRPLRDTADDGSLVYQVQSSPPAGQGSDPAGAGAILGTFNYVPWQEKNPLFRELPGGDLILGTRSLYRRSDQRIHSLEEGTELGFVLDYSVSGSKLALAGKTSQEGDARISIMIRDMDGGEPIRVDSFQYPDYMSGKQAFVCWAGDKLYYDYWQGDRPVVKVYDPAVNHPATFKDYAMNPLASPDGRFLALFASDSPSDKKGDQVGLEMVDLRSGSITGLEGTSRLFWSAGHVTVWDGDRLELHVYELNSGARVKDVPADSPVSDLAFDNGVLRGYEYHFENKQITREQFQVDLK